MKKINLIVTVMAIYVGLMCINTQVFATNKGVAQSETVRIREKKSTDSEIVALLSKDAEVEINGEEGDWYKVTYTKEGKTYKGYVRKDLLKVKENIEKNEPENIQNEESKDEVNTNASENHTNNQIVEIEEGAKGKTTIELQIRIIPLINSSKPQTVKSEEDITIGETLGKWTYVQSNNENGWVMTSELQNNVVKEISENQNNQIEDNKKVEESNIDNTEKRDTDNKDIDKKETKTLYVSSETVNIRKEPNTKSEVLQQVSINETVTVIENVDNIWSKVQVGDKTGYIATEYLSNKRKTVSSRGTEEVRKTVEEQKKEDKNKDENKKQEEKNNEKKETDNKVVTSNAKVEEKKTEDKTSTEKEEKKEEKTSKTTGSDIVAKAKKYLGYKYVLGAASPKSGFDCSGLVYYVYGQFGYKLNRTSGAQASNGKKVSKSNLQLGDVLIFNNSSNTSIGHVGIYIGGNQFIHAANPRKGVIITSLSESYYAKRYVTARRIIN